MSAYSTPIPTPDASRDLTDAEFAELDDLLAATPEPLTPCDAVMLDGYLCGVLVQPVIHTPEEWLPFIFDFDGQPLPDDADPVWKARTTALILRRHDALNRSLVEDGWFDPLVLEFDDEHPMQPPAEGEPDPMADLSPIAQSLMPWVAGFQHAAVSFPDLIELGDDTIDSTLARLYRFLPAENDEERELVALLDAEHPITTLEQGIEDMVMTVAELADLTRDERYHVETIKRETPKLGRNDPCHCGSGKKFKACHGK